MAAYVPPEGYKPPTKKGTSSAVGKGNQVAPQREGESKEAYDKRAAQWQKSYDARGGVKLKDMNQNQLNKYAASGGANRATAIGNNLSRFIGKGGTTTPPPPPATSNTPQQGPSSTPQNLPGNSPKTNGKSGTGDGPRAGTPNASTMGSPAAQGAGTAMSQMPGGGRRNRRRARQAMRRTM